MSKPKILIVGCGAVGLSHGYHLAAGADITFLVRPGRKPAFQPPKKLYDYKEDALHAFENYRVIESPSEVADEDFLFVFDTLDGHTARSAGGRATLKAVGDLIRDHTETFVLYDAIGLDMEEHYATTMGISKERLILVMSMLAHQPTKVISLPATANTELTAQADMFYVANFGDKKVLGVPNTRPKLVKIIGEAYSKHSAYGIRVLPAFVGRSAIMVGMLQLLAASVDGFPPLKGMRANSELWKLLIKGQGEILSLPRFGWGGWLSSWLIGSWVTAKTIEGPVEGAKPLPFYEFNAFHHGAKVIKQDIAVIEEVIAEGEKSKHEMPACREICRRAAARAEEKGLLS
ncbi:ketopantoate reductase ApbA/PanE domain-containing protein [Paraphoma chrysanthemicola]|uniref:Ketopantoate reductase ApbA/PanE domain-containing protein n=1 Tax=Paraphoma chrysanthemicola TaxID=798071 RepID=A0A8K0RBG5_9PLEO|nr:ketopantoate reductase ApbA/PanE domain-containing protein [Paraphoma chrysanthemicola]